MGRDKGKILITREIEDGRILAEKIKEIGFEPVLFPTIKTLPLDFNVENIIDYDVFIFGSKKGVRYFFKKLSDKDVLKKIKSKEFISVGEKTAEELKKYGIKNIKIPEIYSSSGVLKLITENWDYYKDKKILFPKAKKGIDLLEKNLKNIEPVYIYETIFNKPDNIKSVEILFKNEKIYAVIFTSPSTFSGFKEIFSDNWKEFLKKTKIISIGKTTGKTLEKNGILNFYIPEKSTIEGILEIIKNLSLDIPVEFIKKVIKETNSKEE